MFVKNKINPPGCNPLRNEDRMPILSVTSGDTWEIQALLFAADGGPASPENSHVEFVIAENCSADCFRTDIRVYDIKEFFH